MLNEKVIMKRRWKDKLWDKLNRSSILKELYAYIPNNKTVIDVGGNSGYHCRYFAEHAKSVVTYEPVKEIHEVQKENINKFGLTNVDFRNYAVGDVDGEISLYVDIKRASMTSQIPLVESDERKVQMVKLDTQGLSDVGFIKIDVEGFEMQVLKGAKYIIEKYRPACMVEVYQPWSEKTGSSVSETFEWFEPLGYKCYMYDCNIDSLVQIKTVLEFIKAVMEDHSKHDGDFLFVGD